MITVATTPEVAATYAGLRAWAKGIYHVEAAVELLIRGRWAGPSRPWIQACDTWPGEPQMWFVDWEVLEQEMGVLSGGEQRYLRIASLIGRDQLDVAGIDREHVDLILAAIAHAAGTHEGSVATFNPDGRITGFTQPGTLHAWPKEAF